MRGPCTSRNDSAGRRASFQVMKGMEESAALGARAAHAGCPQIISRLTSPRPPSARNQIISPLKRIECDRAQHDDLCPITAADASSVYVIILTCRPLSSPAYLNPGQVREPCMRRAESGGGENGKRERATTRGPV